MKLKWLGHSCFYITSDAGTRIVIDPFDATVGYKVPDVQTDIVTISHSHFDHNYTRQLKGSFQVVNQQGEHEIRDIKIKGVNTYHDEVGGQKRGSNIVFNLCIDRLNVCHMGDIGHIPDDRQVKDIGRVDVLMVPVGGIFTIDADEALKVVELLRPEIIIPMHYKTPDLKFDLAKVNKFIDKVGIQRLLKLVELEIAREDIKEYKGKVIVMEY